MGAHLKRDLFFIRHWRSSLEVLKLSYIECDFRDNMAFMKFMNIGRFVPHASTNNLHVMSPGFCSLSFLFLLRRSNTLIPKMAAKRESLNWSMASWKMEFNHALTSLCYKTIINLVTRKLNLNLK